MPDISVEQFAKVVNISVNNLLSQLEKAGIVKKNKSDLISDEEKMQLLEFFRNNKNNINNNQKKENPVEDNLRNEKKVVIRKKRVFSKSTKEKIQLVEPEIIENDESDSNNELGRNDATGNEVIEANKNTDTDKSEKSVTGNVKKRKRAKTKFINEDSEDGFKGTKKKKAKLQVADDTKARFRSPKKQQKNTNLDDKHQFELPKEPTIYEVELPENISVSDLAKKINVKAAEVIKSLMSMGVMSTINEVLDQDTAILVIEEMGHKAKAIDYQNLEKDLLKIDNNNLSSSSRPPVITIMGHVDHGKTSLLDYIRTTRIASGEAGGITQHIGAYQVNAKKGQLTFLDTPGHAAFTSMRARGANCTDIVILVVAADDGVKPQTIEAIQHSKAANVPVIVAVNKIDKEGADIEKAKTELSKHDVVPEEWGGDNIFVPVSAKTGEGVDDLLESINLVSEVLELKAVNEGPSKGVVLESSLDKQRGPIATILVKEGQMKSGDNILCGKEFGRIRAMLNDVGEKIEIAKPSTPVVILGLSGTPNVGDESLSAINEKNIREVVSIREDQFRDKKLSSQNNNSQIDNMFNKLEEGKKEVLNIMLKTDVQGSSEAIMEALLQLSTDEVIVKIISSSAGAINESDIILAEASKAMILGFNVRADSLAKKLANEKSLDIRYYSVIYELIDDVKLAMSGLLSPELREEIIGLAEVKDVFKSSAMGAVAGCQVVDGSVKKGNPIRVLRDNIVIYEGELESLRRHKDEANEVKTGTECGIAVKNYNDVKVGDQIEVYERVEIARKL